MKQRTQTEAQNSVRNAEFYMREALKQSKKAAAQDEVPVGAVIVLNGKIIARACNKTRAQKSPLAHAEVLAIKKAAAKIGDWRLSEADIYVTLEPCAMCAGALALSRINAIYFGASDPLYGACGSALDIPASFRPNHAVKSVGGILAEECSTLLKDYFKQKRQKK